MQIGSTNNTTEYMREGWNVDASRMSRQGGERRNQRAKKKPGGVKERGAKEQSLRGHGKKKQRTVLVVAWQDDFPGRKSRGSGGGGHRIPLSAVARRRGKKRLSGDLQRWVLVATALPASHEGGTREDGMVETE